MLGIREKLLAFKNVELVKDSKKGKIVREFLLCLLLQQI